MDGHIYIKGEITHDYSDYVQKQIDALGPVSKIIVHIKSPGGSVYGGYNTYHTLRSTGKPIDAIIEGECMSIATLISLAADKIRIKNPSRYMIHNPALTSEGFLQAKDMEKEAEELRRIEGEMAELYVQKTGMPIDRVKAMMDKETYMTAKEAVEFGFVDSMDYELKKVAIGKSITMDENQKSILDKLASLLGITKQEKQAVSLPLQDGSELMIDGEDGDLEGKAATINGEPANGEYVLADGRKIMVENGVVVSVSAAEEPADLKALKDQIAALTAENEQLKATKVAQETSLGEIKAQVAELRKMTVGNKEKPKTAVKKEPVAQEQVPEWKLILAKELGIN